MRYNEIIKEATLADLKARLEKVGGEVYAQMHKGDEVGYLGINGMGKSAVWFAMYPDGTMQRFEKRPVETDLRDGWTTKSIKDPATVAAEKQKADRERAAYDKMWGRDTKPVKTAKPSLYDIYQKVEDAIGISFPDGDPIDHFGGWLSRNNLSMDDVDRAYRKYGKAKSYDAYLAQMWDDHQADRIHDARMGSPDDNSPFYSVGDDGSIEPEQNPWR